MGYLQDAAKFAVATAVSSPASQGKKVDVEKAEAMMSLPSRIGKNVDVLLVGLFLGILIGGIVGLILGVIFGGIL